MKRLVLLSLCAVAFMAGTAHAALVNVALGKDVHLSGEFYYGWVGAVPGAGQTLTDGVVLPEWHQWDQGTVFWSGASPAVTIDLENNYRISQMLLSVDNNDWYAVDYSTDNVSFTRAFEISGYAGNVGWGLDTFYPEELDFEPFNARYIKLYATGGDGWYSSSEVQAFAPTPIPGAAWLLGSGLVGLLGLRRKFRG